MPSILIVDDAVYIRKQIMKDLEGTEYRIVAEASSGDEAIGAYRKYRPDIVIMDVVMPGKSGVDTAGAILSMDPKARVVLISSLENEIVVIKSLEAGAKDFLVKPFTRETLLKVLKSVK